MIPASLVILIIGDRILSIFGEDYYRNATPLLWLLALSCIPYTFNRMYITLKKIEYEINTVIAINAAIAIIGLGSAYLLMNRIGLIGIGVGWLLGQGIVMMWVWLKYIQVNYLDKFISLRLIDE